MDEQITGAERAADATAATAVGLWVNVALVIVKFIAGIVSSSGAMIADAAHSLSDTLTDIAVIVGFRFVARPPDDDHEYGHGKFETLAAAFCGVMLAAAGIGILSGSVRVIYDAVRGGDLPDTPGLSALAAAILSVVVKEALYRYTVYKGKSLSSPALVANAWHHRSDALSSVGTAIGIGGAAFLGGRFVLLDPAAAFVVGLLIMKASASLLLDSCQELVEASIGPDGERAVEEAIASCKGVEGFHAIKSRRIGCGIAVDAHVFVDPTLSVVKGHDIATGVEQAIKALFGPSTYVNIHIEPSKLDRKREPVLREGD